MEEEDMEMEVIAEEEEERVFVAYEIDIDYEFDAARFLDFTRLETPDEARQAELWFHTAPSYPPSPFVTKLVMRENIVPENIRLSTKFKELNGTTTLEDSTHNACLIQEFAAANANDEVNCMLEKWREYTDLLQDASSKTTGRGFSSNLRQTILQSEQDQSLQFAVGLNKGVNEKQKAQSRCTGKSFLARSSTLMKPTASQLAKQNSIPQVTASRFQKLMVGNEERCLNIASVMESQAAKRRKLDRGLLHKVFGTKPETEFFHKPPNKDEKTAKSSDHSTLRLTIPREPDLETTHRAQRIRPKINAETDIRQLPTRKFKALPLNRKILNAPSLPLPKKSIPKLPEFQEFHLKTQERAMQQTSLVTSSSHCCTEANKCLDKKATFVTETQIKDARRPIATVTSKHERLDSVHKFKARPLNRKIFSSKGDMGIFRNIKQETTVPMEFKFHTEKRVLHNPPLELFRKLTLTSELHSKDEARLKQPKWTCPAVKGLKENRLNCSHPQQEITNLVKGKSSTFSGKQIQGVDDGCNIEGGSRMSTSRIMGIR